MLNFVDSLFRWVFLLKVSYLCYLGLFGGDLVQEVWKDIEGYEGLYQISNFGRVKSFVKSRPKIKSLSNDKDGYLLCVLNKLNKKRTFKVHRLVAMSFIPNPENKSQVNHKDGNKHNNIVDNLEWVTPVENMYHARINGLRSSMYHGVSQYDLSGNLIQNFNSVTEAAGFIGGSRSCIVHCCNGRQLTAYGYAWKYLD